MKIECEVTLYFIDFLKKFHRPKNISSNYVENIQNPIFLGFCFQRIMHYLKMFYSHPIVQ